MEIFDENPAFTTIGLRTPGWPLYPHLFLLADDRIIYTGGSLGGGPVHRSST